MGGTQSWLGVPLSLPGVPYPDWRTPMLTKLDAPILAGGSTPYLSSRDTPTPPSTLPSSLLSPSPPPPPLHSMDGTWNQRLQYPFPWKRPWTKYRKYLCEINPTLELVVHEPIPVATPHALVKARTCVAMHVHKNWQIDLLCQTKW